MRERRGLTITITFPDVCAMCGKRFKDGEERVGIIRKRAPEFAADEGYEGRWGFTFEGPAVTSVEFVDGFPTISTEAHHVACAKYEERG